MQCLLCQCTYTSRGSHTRETLGEALAVEEGKPLPVIDVNSVHRDTLEAGHPAEDVHAVVGARRSDPVTRPLERKPKLPATSEGVKREHVAHVGELRGAASRGLEPPGEPELVVDGEGRGVRSRLRQARATDPPSNRCEEK